MWKKLSVLRKENGMHGDSTKTWDKAGFIYDASSFSVFSSDPLPQGYIVLPWLFNFDANFWCYILSHTLQIGTFHKKHFRYPFTVFYFIPYTFYTILLVGLLVFIYSPGSVCLSRAGLCFCPLYYWTFQAHNCWRVCCVVISQSQAGGSFPSPLIVARQKSLRRMGLGLCALNGSRICDLHLQDHRKPNWRDRLWFHRPAHSTADQRFQSVYVPIKMHWVQITCRFAVWA